MSTDARRAAQAGEVMAALLDFEQLPGRYPVAMREPRILFEQAGLVLMLAAGRRPDGLSAAVEPEVSRAACFFVRTVMLRPGVDFYTLLGVPQTFDAEELREHYRLMIRMTHPDFVASGKSWPADAAARINQAHDVLVSAVKRAGYRATLEGARARPKPPGISAHGQRQRTPADAARRRWPMVSTMGLAAAVALLALTALVMSWPTSDEGQLTVAVRAPLVLPAAPMPDSTVPVQAVELPVVMLAEIEPGALQAPVQPARNVARVYPVAAGVAARERVVRESALPAGAVPELAVREAPPAAPAPFSASVVVASPAAEPTVRAPELVAPNITMDQVQPLLTNLLQSLQSGRGEQVLQWLERSARQSDAAAHFVDTYNRSLAGNRVTGLGTVRFTSRFDAGQLVVDGMVQLRLVDERQQTSMQDVRLRATFLPRDSAPVLARLEAF